MLTACGIETSEYPVTESEASAVATVLTACGIETFGNLHVTFQLRVATVLTACGIETFQIIVGL